VMKWQMASRTAALSSITRIQGMGRETTRIAYLRQYEFSVFFVVLCSRSAPASMVEAPDFEFTLSLEGSGEWHP